jgi:hypothetical protein
MPDRRIPYWPRRMKLPLAASYVDESQTKFNPMEFGIETPV